MAATPHSRSCPIRLISVHLLDAAGQLLRVLFLDREGHICAQPHYVPREEALILASNQQRVLGPQAEVRVLWRACPAALPLGLLQRGCGSGRSTAVQPSPTYTGWNHCIRRF